MKSAYFNTPFTGLKISQQDNQLSEIDFVSAVENESLVNDVFLLNVLEQISHYLESADYHFNLPMNPQGTEFQKRVWEYLCQIPTGQVRTYGEVAKDLETSARAVGNACRANPIPLIVPCHRVISAQGIGGFAWQTQGQRISIKRQLLAHEGVEI